MGKDVHFVELAPRLLARVASPSLSDCCTKLHATAGVKIFTNAAFDDILAYEKGQVKAVLLVDGTALMSQRVLANIGVIPDAHFAKKVGLAIDNGVVVSVFYRSYDSAIWAIGDFANAPDRHVLRIESTQHAELSGQIAAADMLGTTIPT